jgi:drug/metabolite transporter (DMT)-like permease
MGLGGCLLLIAGGAILTFATDWEVSGFNLDVAGLIMMAVGLIGVAAYTSLARRRRAVVPPVAPVVEADPLRDDGRHL